MNACRRLYTWVYTQNSGQRAPSTNLQINIRISAVAFHRLDLEVSTQVSRVQSRDWQAVTVAGLKDGERVG